LTPPSIGYGFSLTRKARSAGVCDYEQIAEGEARNSTPEGQGKNQMIFERNVIN